MTSDNPLQAPDRSPTGRSPRQVRQAKLLGQAAAALQLLAVVFNFLACAFWALSLIWVGVGLFWVLLMAVLVWEGVGAVEVLVYGRRRHGAWGPGAGAIVSLLNFNVITLLVELVALGMVVSAGRGAAQE